MFLTLTRRIADRAPMAKYRSKYIALEPKVVDIVTYISILLVGDGPGSLCYNLSTSRI